MRKTKVFVAATGVLILAGVGWASFTADAGRTAAAAPISVQIDTFEAMVKAKDLPNSHYDDYSLVFLAPTLP